MLKRFLAGVLLLAILAYAAAAVMLALKDQPLPPPSRDLTPPQTITIFGASGTAGDGILKAALADPNISRIHVVTRRSTPRMEQGIAAGKVQMTTHMDYTDYAAVRDQIADSDAVFWALGTSSLGVDEQTYARIHVDFPMQFVSEWVEVSSKQTPTFHYISSSDISEDSSMMWARQKVRAEQSLTAFANDHDLKVVLYRPDYIGPTAEEAHLGQKLVYGFFRPIGAAVRARQIGQAMLEVSARSSAFDNGDKLGTRTIVRYSDAYRQRHDSATP